MLVRQQFGIEMIEARLHFGFFDRGKILLAQIRRRLDATVAARQPQIVLLGDEPVRGRPFLVMITGSRKAAS